MMLNVMILEDCAESRTALTTIIKEITEGIHAFSVSSIEDARQVLQSKEKIDLFLLDINLDPGDDTDQSGLLFARMLREDIKYLFVPIIFVTSNVELEITSYRETYCYRYIKKPFMREEVEAIVNKVLSYKEETKDKQITIKKDGINYRIKVNEIVYMKAETRGTLLVLTSETVYVKYTSIKQILEKISFKDIVQCHRMFVINLNYIEYIDFVNRIVKMSGYDEIIEIGVTYKNGLRSRING